MKKILVVCALMMLVAVNAWADTVTFKSGKKIEGTIKSITNDTVTVDLYGVTEMTYDLADIQEINGQVVELNKPAAATAEAPAPEAAAPVTVPVAPAPAAETPPAADQTASPTENITPPPAIAETPEKTAEAVTPNGTQQEMMPDFKAGGTPGIFLSDKQKAEMIAWVKAIAGIILIVGLIVYIYRAICLQLIANKTDTEFGWLAWVPIGSLFLMCNIGKVKYKWLIPSIFSYFWFILILIPFIGGLFLVALGFYNLFLTIFLWYHISIARGKPGWLGILSFISIVNVVIWGYLAFSKKEEGAAPVPNIGGGQPANQLGTAPTYRPPLE